MSAPRPIRIALFAALPAHHQVPLYRRIATDSRFDFTAIFGSTAGLRPADLGYGQPVMLGGENLISGYRAMFTPGARSDTNLESAWSLRDPHVATMILRGRYEVLWLHGYNSVAHLLALAAQSLRGGAVMFREDQTLLHPRSLPRTLVKELALRLLFRRRYGLCVGTEVERWFEHYGIPPERLFSAPYAVDNERLRRASAELRPQRTELRRELGLAPDKPVLLTVSRLIPKKQPLALLEGFRRARERIECSLLIVGAGELEEPLRREIARQSIPDVVLAGFLDQAALPRAYASADAFALFSARDETFGLVVAEAMNFGLPVIVSDKVGCAIDLVSDGRNGRVVSSIDVEALEAAIMELLGDPQRAEKLGQASLDMVAAFNTEAAARGVVEAVAAAVGDARWAEAEGVAANRDRDQLGPVLSGEPR